MKKKFLAVYTGSEEGMMKKWGGLDEKARQEREQAGMHAWHAWVKKNEKAIVDGGAPLGATKQVDLNGVKDIHNQLTAFTIVEAESHEAAAKLFLDHPHFKIFPGDSVEIMECLPIPGM